MALILLQVLVLGVTAAAVDDEALAWSQRGPCAVAAWTKIQQRPPPPPLDDGGIPHTWSSPNGTLEVMREPDDHQVHQCAVTHHGGIVLGYPLSLQVLYTDAELKPQHQDEKTPAARPQVVPCDLDGRYRLPGNDNRYFTVQSETLNLDLNTENEAHYRCKATKPKRYKSSNYEDRLEDSFYEDKYDNNVGQGRSKVLLTCPLHGWPRRNFTWELTPAGDDADEVLVLPNLEHDQEGVFTCTALGGHKNASVIEPVRMLHSPVSKEARRASTVRFNCTATGNPKPRISWYKDGRPLVTSAQINVRKSPDGQRQELVIGGLTVDNAGVYQCFAHGPGGFASGWAQLNVTGPRASPPEAVRCFPVNAHSVELRWEPAFGDLAYTVSIEPRDRADAMQQPFNTTHTVSKLEKPLTPYKFQVRAYLTYGASDFSPVVVCQGQGVPIKMMKIGEDKVVVSWKSFAEQTPGVVQWVLQYRPQDSALPHNVTLPGAVHNYTLTVTPGKPMLVRLLGSRTLDWLPQNLSLVSWTSTARAGHDLDDGPVEATVEDVSVTAVRPRVVSLRWRCVRCPPRHSFRVCARASHGPDECRDSVKPNATIDGLSPDTVYELRVQVRVAGRPPGPFSAPYQVTTQADGPQRINVTYKFVNESAVLVSWGGPAAAYTVYHSAQLLLPVELWDDVSVAGNSVLITGIRPTEKTYVMVTDHDPQRSSPILTVPPYRDTVPQKYSYEYSARGVVVHWEGGGSRLVRYSQNITRPLETWPVVNATGGVVELEILEPSLPTFVQFPGYPDQPLNIPPRPPSNQYLGLEVGCTVGILCLMAVVAACLWRRRKRMQQPGRSRRSHAAAVGSEEEGSEMKTVGARLCNGAGEPLLNGHVHITENPASKTPNGRMKRGRRLENQFDAFDLSRNDADTTHETMLDDSCAFDATRPEPTKLPDDNMNVEPGFRDNSQAQPTLQPNG